MLTVLQEHLWTSEWLLSGVLCWAVCFKNQHRRGGRLGEGIFSFALGLPVFSWHPPTNCFFPSVLIPNFEPSPQELLHSIQWCFRDLIVAHGPIFTTDQNNSVTLQFFSVNSEAVSMVCNMFCWDVSFTKMDGSVFSLIWISLMFVVTSFYSQGVLWGATRKGLCQGRGSWGLGLAPWHCPSAWSLVPAKQEISQLRQPRRAFWPQAGSLTATKQWELGGSSPPTSGMFAKVKGQIAGPSTAGHLFKWLRGNGERVFFWLTHCFQRFAFYLSLWLISHILH